MIDDVLYPTRCREALEAKRARRAARKQRTLSADASDRWARQVLGALAELAPADSFYVLARAQGLVWRRIGRSAGDHA